MKNHYITFLFALLLVLTTLSSCMKPKSSGMNNMIARMEVKEPIEGICDNDNVIVVLPFSGNGQIEAVAPMTDEEITEMLNKEVSFLEGKDEYEDKGMVGILVNCKGEMVRCLIDNKTKSPELDNQIVAVFSKMKKWTAATFNKKPVDSHILHSFTIKNGEITLN